MNAVLYTHQLEPITVVDLPMWLWDRLAAGDHIRLEVPEPFSLDDLEDEAIYCRPRSVTIFGERFRRREHESLMLFTGDEENALLLRAAFLPGQRSEVSRREQGSFAAGFLRALQEYR